MLNAIIIEDEISNRINLKNLLHKFCAEEICILGETGEVKAAIHMARDLQPDLIFLDIRLSGGDGFQVLDGLLGQQGFQVIFVTSYDEFAIQAIKYAALDYLVKPIDVDELKLAVQKAARAHQKPEQAAETSQRGLTRQNSLSIPTRNGLVILPITHLLHSKAEGSYSQLALAHERPLLISKNLRELEELLPPNLFFRTHRSHLINVDQVRSYSHQDEPSVTMSNGDQVPVSRRRRSALLSILRSRSSRT